MVAGELVPISFFVLAAVVIMAAMYFRNERAQASGGGDYRKLAEEAVRGQRAILEQQREMNHTLQEIERLLKEV